ncbi:RAMP superfamily CRISPR-associated protein [Sulfurisphaera javensis]|uniref:RAMP superfamily CRISPR-associated protein n=1 Tax=Sulfurisphaera javensis TaxID=2049879 RepID=A0AAT9GV89_9CREN
MKFKVWIKNYTSLTIGGGSEGKADISISDLVIPPSSIKGAMRTAINFYLKETDLKNKYSSCYEIRPDKIKERHSNGKPCDVCKLFGYPDSKDIGCFTINVVTDVEKLPKYVLTRVSIEDKTQKAKEGALFSQETIPPENEIEIEIDFRCDDNHMLKLLLYSLSALRLWRLGRNSLIDLKVEDICQKVNNCDNEMREIFNSLKDYMW